MKEFSVFKENTAYPKRLILSAFFFLLFSFLFPVKSIAQEINASIDRDSIKIGEQITYSILVETDSTDLVVFPEGQSFSPLEMFESFPVDTSKVENRFKFLKEYALTQFDSGTYTIPPQRININSREFLTDSMLVIVNDVVVDTTKQKLYPIKPSVEIPPRFSFPQWGWWILGLLLLLLLIFLFFRRRRKKAEAAKRLPPYEQAIFELQQLDNSHLLEKREIKEYYSQLSAAVRKYLDEEVYDHAMESTTAELILYLEAQKNSGKLNIDNRTLENLQEMLRRADLAKFANSKPDVITAKEDRSKAEMVINDTKEGIPQPTEEELLRDQEYRKRKERKRKQRKIALFALIIVVIVGAFAAYMISTQGFSYIKDNYFGHPSKELLEGEWIRSEYGNPPVAITTPEVLLRTAASFTKEEEAVLAGAETFVAGNLHESYFVSLSTRQFRDGTEFNLNQAVEGIYSYLEDKGAKNIITKQEEISTLSGVKGIRSFGSFVIEDSESGKEMEKEYSILNFGQQNGLQQIILIYDEEDIYADEITQRIIASVELNSAEK
ncbi:MAG TPA: DUF4381 family protein [Salinimicrobium sp.]|nr:DUF4381 family protein [Salinimicrobium sp.]